MLFKRSSINLDTKYVMNYNSLPSTFLDIKYRLYINKPINYLASAIKKECLVLTLFEGTKNMEIKSMYHFIKVISNLYEYYDVNLLRIKRLTGIYGSNSK